MGHPESCPIRALDNLVIYPIRGFRAGSIPQEGNGARLLGHGNGWPVAVHFCIERLQLRFHTCVSLFRLQILHVVDAGGEGTTLSE